MGAAPVVLANVSEIGKRNCSDSEPQPVISVRFLAVLSTFLLVTGALLVGQSLHGSVVTGEYAVTSPWAVLRAALGLVFIALGYRFQTPASEYSSLPSESGAQGDESSSGTEPSDFDPELSPLSEEQFENLDADEAETNAAIIVSPASIARTPRVPRAIVCSRVGGDTRKIKLCFLPDARAVGATPAGSRRAPRRAPARPRGRTPDRER